MSGHCCRSSSSGKATPGGACLARRMLTGIGRAQLLISSGLEELETLGHRWSPSAEALIVACTASDQWSLPDGTVHEAQLVIDKAAPLPEVKLLSGSLYAMAELQVLGVADRLAIPDRELGPLAELSWQGEVRLCALRLQQVVLHLAGRVECHEPIELLAGVEPADPAAELDRATEVLAHGEDALRGLVHAVVTGRRPGEAVLVCSHPPNCEQLVNRVLPIDVSAHDLKLLITSARGAEILTAPFGGPAGTPQQLRREVARLLSSHPAAAEQG